MVNIIVFQAVFILVFPTSLVLAWGQLGHATVASIAMHFLLPETRLQVHSILAHDPAPFVVLPQTSTSASITVAATSQLSRSLSSSIAATNTSTSTTVAQTTLTLNPRSLPSSINTAPNLIDIASWADDYRVLPEGAFSAPFHYVDAEDSPPHACNVITSRDCGAGGCVISAIANYTTRMRDATLDATQRAQALKWVTHFVGDIQQPLHDEAVALGGNEINILWNGTTANLHHIWDTEMITKLAGPFTPTSISSWTSTILRELTHRNGLYRGKLYDWVACSDIDNVEGCPLEWAQEANAYVCSYVLATDPAAKEMNSTYYDGAAPIIQQQIAKGGVRLAAWLNQAFAGESGFW
ncbi:hypothetical protein FRB96_005970 [Tulasnella sp. 330]|nr:hypothetical protein FRB96_005970 [Tulasnella sp. 330]KAG8888566.1 hypothetical protein FRB98_007431 [Tulasnella sp. 332]